MRIVNQVTRLLWSMIVLVGTLSLIGYLAAVAWRELGPHKPIVNPVRRELASHVLDDVLHDLRTQRTNASSVVLLHFAGDETDHISDTLRALLTSSGILSVSEPTLDEKLQRELGLAITSPANLETAVARARGLGPKAVLFGVVREFSGTSDEGRLTLELTLADITSAQTLFAHTYDRQWKPMPLEPVLIQEHLSHLGPLSRLFAWALLVLLLPVFSIGFLRATIRRGSNRANFGILTLYTSVAAILAWLVVGATFQSFWSAAWFAGLAGLAFAYHVWIMTVAVRLENQ